MKRLTPILPVLCMFALLFARPAFAGPAKPAQIAADAKWFVHLDAEAARKTVVYEQALELLRGQFPIDDVVDQLKTAIGINPLTDISGITVYNTSFEQDVAAVLIYAKVNQEMLALAISNNADYKQVEYGKHIIHTWTDENDHKTKVGGFFGDGLVLMADKIETLKAAYDVLDGTKPGGSALVKAPAEGVFLYGAADLAGAHSADKNFSQLLSNAQTAAVSAAETEGKLKVTVKLNTRSAEVAAQLKKMIDGVKAFGELAARPEHPTVADLLATVRVTLEGGTITGTIEHESKTLLQTLQKIDDENKAIARKAAEAPATKG